MDDATLRAWWAHKQGLLVEDRSLEPAQVLDKMGWCRSVAGCNPYLTLFSRAGISRERADLSVKQLEISELPAARRCTYVVPKGDFTTALACGAKSESAEWRLAISLGASVEEMEALKVKVLRVLEGGAKDPQGLKAELGDAVRKFGEAGKKKGTTTSLSPVLGELQSEGQIVRRPSSGRLDDQKYSYERWPGEPPNPKGLSYEIALQQLAARFFRWIGPAPLSDFALLAGISAKAAIAATSSLGLVTIPELPAFLILPEEEESFRKFERPQDPVYRLLNCLDSSVLLHEAYGILFDEGGEDALWRFQDRDRGKNVTKDLGFNPIVDRGTIIGLWEYDPAEKEIVSVCFGESSQELRKEISKTETFVRDELGDARTFSLDSPKSREPKLKRLRKGL